MTLNSTIDPASRSPGSAPNPGTAAKWLGHPWISQTMHIDPTAADTGQAAAAVSGSAELQHHRRIQLVSATAVGTQGDYGSETFRSAPRNWSPDGTRVLFGSTAQNFSGTDNNTFNRDIFVKSVG